jgi:ABC-2 type transport system permease protein
MTDAAHTLGIYGREARAQILSVSRMPQFIVPSLLLPLIFYGMVGLGLAHGREEVARLVLGGYVIFAATAPSLFGFGAGLAAEREAKLVELKRVSPMPIGAYLTGRVASALAVVTLTLVLMAVLAMIGGVQMAAWRWAAVIGVGIVSVVPLSLIGMNIGLRLGAQGAVAVANLTFLVLCLFGGLWIPLDQMPAWIHKLAWFLPSFHLSRLSLMLVGAAPAQQIGEHLAILGVMTAIAAVGAWIGWRRQPT